ncbi:MAG: ABC transporter ATP-binding protein [Chloroflexi bacterium]|nr:ABC transporter ATP-binding protein [Chloroflexota bacterium]MCY3587464.1 ABC transporter ATP-binding protein [Chloroflexota bacterium]MCY3685494.1 ABC transporter ATP-binding protein [Chloroflexota bacterium]MDE2708396.1 ABC transporter ATP-binding protein [Chloroflexota bacterium]MXX48084.1 ABC transporter ATP-binding protein [Chloroflexota bacterium]
MADPLLSVQNLSTSFFTSEGVVRAVNDVSYDLMPGQTLGLVGESGSGKSVSALSLLRLIPNPPGKIVNGEVWFDGEELMSVDDSRMREIRGNDIAMVFQEPMTSLNPVLTIGRQLTEAIELHMGLGRTQANERAIELLNMVGIPAAEQRLFDFPHQFSGGMRQRVMIAMALSCDPKLLLADEPTTALDVTIQAQVLEVMARLSRELGTAVIVITHNLGVVARYADRVNVMYGGRIVESGEAGEIYARPKHAYTLGLLESVPRLDARTGRLIPIEGTPPDLTNMPEGCAFAPRCRFVTDQCIEERPELVEFAPGHLVACWHSEAVAAEADAILASAHTEEVLEEETANV